MEEPENDQEEAPAELRPSKGSLPAYLRPEFGGPDDGPGNELRKETHEKSEVGKIRNSERTRMLKLVVFRTFTILQSKLEIVNAGGASDLYFSSPCGEQQR